MARRHIIGVDEDVVALLAIVKLQRVVHLNEAEAPLSTVFDAPGWEAKALLFITE